MSGDQKQFKAIDLFAGAGGLSCSAKNVGIRLLAAVEHDIHAQATYRRNFVVENGAAPILYSDITETDPSTLLDDLGMKPGELDILMGGPPCQGFSTHRIKDAGVGDPRNELLLRYFLFVQVLAPKSFLVENVPGLLWPRHATYLNSFKALVESAGYTLHGPIELNAKDYGVPQNRKRVFMVGFRNDLKTDFNWPEPTHHDPKSNKRPFWRNAKCVFSKPLKALDKDPNAIHMNHSEEMIERFKATPLNGGSRKDSGYTLKCHENHNGHKDVYGRIDPNKPGPTMTTACINPSKGRFVHPTEHHGIAVRHAARFQTFPESFVFEGGLMATAKQVGNAVPVKLGQSVLLTICNTLSSIDEKKASRLS
jgi:DNA (cytosine-5)-methyltransferase 1